MTDPSQEQLDRLAKLRRGSSISAADPSPANRSRRRRHPAQGSRIVAAGLGAGTMFGIVTVLGLNNPISQAEEPAPEAQPAFAAPAAPVAPPVEVRVHMIPSTTTFADQEPAADAASIAPVVSAQAGPIELTANPVVRTVTVVAPTQTRPQAAPSAAAPQPTPVATTSGSS